MRRRAHSFTAAAATFALVGGLTVGLELARPSAAEAAAGCTTATPNLLQETTCSTAGTDSVTVPNGAVYVKYTVVGGGGGGATTYPPLGTSGSGAQITGVAQIPANTATMTVVVGAGGARGADVGSSYSDGGRGGEGSGLFAVDGSSNVLADLVVAGGGGGAGSASTASSSGSMNGGNAGIPGSPAGSGAATVSWPGANASGNPGQGADGSTPGSGGTGSGPNGSADGTTGGTQATGTVAAGAARAGVPWAGSPRYVTGAGGGGYSGGGSGGGGTNGGIFVAAGGGGGSSFVHPTYVLAKSAAVVSSAGPGYRGNTGLSYAYGAITPTAGGTGLVKLTFSVTAPPTVASITPTGGTTAGGTPVTIRGTGFVDGATVKIGGNSATNVTFVSSTELSATTPAGTAGAKDVVVTNPDTQSGTGLSLYTYAVPPTVTSISPPTGPESGSTSVTIGGSGFVNGATVKIGGNSATNVTFNNANSLTATTPAGTAGARDVVVTNPNNLSGTGSGLFTYIAAPTVTAISPVGGPLAGSTQVTISGTGFANGATVKIGGAAATDVNFVSDTEITAKTPAGAAGPADVVVTNPDTQSGTGPGLYTYADAPTVSAITPSSGSKSGGTAVTITGTGFADGATVKIGGTAATDVNFVSETALTAKTPAGTAGKASVVVTNPDEQSGTGTDLYTYTSAPEVTAISPETGTTAGGTRVTITGSGFIDGATVKIGGTAAKDVIFVSDTTLAATTPIGVLGPADVEVVNPDSTSGTGKGLYTYTATGPSSPERLDEIPLGSNPNLPASGLKLGASLLLVDGQKSPVTVTPNAKKNATSLVVSAPGLNMQLAGRGDVNDPLGLTPKQALILQSETSSTASAASESRLRAKPKVKPTARTNGDGFAPLTPVKLYLLKVGYLGTVNTDRSGAFDGSVPIPPGIKPGPYTLQANGFAPDYSVRSLNIGVLVQSNGKVKQRPVEPLNLPASVKRSGTTTLLAAPVRTNAGQTARVEVRCASSSAGAAGELRLCTVIRKGGAVKVKTFGTPTRVLVFVRAKAVSGYTAYTKVKAYRS